MKQMEIRVTTYAIERAYEVAHDIYMDLKLNEEEALAEWLRRFAQIGWDMPELHQPTGASGIAVTITFEGKRKLRFVYDIQQGQPVLATVMRVMK